MANVTSPLMIPFTDWASQINIDLPNLQIPNPPTTISQWRDWASQIINIKHTSN